MKISSTRKIIILLSLFTTAVFALTLGSLFYYNRSIEQAGFEDRPTSQIYSRHYVLITENRELPFWQDIYVSANQVAAEHDARLELLGGQTSREYSIEELMQIAIYSDVDGIIIEPNGNPKIASLIDMAVEQNIPVVTVLQDEPQSKRISYVGVNSYEMGSKYAQQVLNAIDTQTKSVLLLFAESEMTPANNMVYTRVREMIDTSIYRNQGIEIQTLFVGSNRPFETEEAIRDVFIGQQHVPDILVCTNAMDTEVAYQAMVNYNRVGEIDIIGFYSTDTILHAIAKGNIRASFALDTDQVAGHIMEALTEYIEIRHVSEYYTIDVSVVDLTNVHVYLVVDDEDEDQ